MATPDVVKGTGDANKRQFYENVNEDQNNLLIRNLPCK
jgi:hypothetical protein